MRNLSRVALRIETALDSLASGFRYEDIYVSIHDWQNPVIRRAPGPATVRASLASWSASSFTDTVTGDPLGANSGGAG